MNIRQYLIVAALVAAVVGCVGTPTEQTVQEKDTVLSDQARFEKWIVQHRAKHESMQPAIVSGSGGMGDPTPIPGGLGGGVFHVWLPGPVTLGAQGLDVEPSTINDFKGFSAVAFLAGTVTASDGVTYDMFHDMRIFQGSYIADDGAKKNGSFAFI
jgi:hypothetical protein